MKTFNILLIVFLAIHSIAAETHTRFYPKEKTSNISYERFCSHSIISNDSIPLKDIVEPIIEKVWQVEASKQALKEYKQFLKNQKLEITTKGKEYIYVKNLTRLPLEIKILGKQERKPLFPGQSLTLNYSELGNRKSIQAKLHENVFYQLFYWIWELDQLEIELNNQENPDPRLVQKIKDNAREYGLSFLYRIPGAQPTSFQQVNTRLFMDYLKNAYYTPDAFPQIFSVIDLSKEKRLAISPPVFFEGMAQYGGYGFSNVFSSVGFLSANLGIPLTKEFEGKKGWYTRYYLVGKYALSAVQGFNKDAVVYVADRYTVSNYDVQFIDNSKFRMENYDIPVAIRMRKMRNPTAALDLEIGTIVSRKSNIVTYVGSLDTMEYLNQAEFDNTFEKPNPLKNFFINAGITFDLSSEANPAKSRNKRHAASRGLTIGISGGLYMYEQTINADFPFVDATGNLIEFVPAKKFYYNLGVGVGYAF